MLFICCIVKSTLHVRAGTGTPKMDHDAPLKAGAGTPPFDPP